MSFLTPILAQAVPLSNAPAANVPTAGGPATADAPATVWYDFGFWDVVLAVLAVLFVYYLLRYRVTILKFVGEVKVELDKCSWPWDANQTGFKKYKELIESTVVVVISVVLLAGFVTSSDFVLAHLVGFLTGTGITAGGNTPTLHPLH